MSNYINYILLDNFRGFSKTVIPLKKVNFLVGENSAGKSSVLSLIKIISELYFWFKPEFRSQGSQDINLGHSEDLISISATDRSFFRVGYLKSSNLNKKNEGDTFFDAGFLITFSDRNGTPEPIRISIQVAKNTVLHIKISENALFSKLELNNDLEVSSCEEAERKMNELIGFHINGIGYTKVKLKYKDKKNIFEVLHTTIASIKQINSSILELTNTLYANKNPIWLAPIRSKPKRTYDEPTNDFSSEGEHTPYLISNMLISKLKSDKLLLEKIGSQAGLFKKILVKKYGRAKNAPFELDVVLQDKALSIVNVGYGVSQSMPIIAEIIFSPNNSFFIIQQPEVHLHPVAQAAIGSLIYESKVSWNDMFLVETHSDYLIDRYRLNLKESYGKNNDANGEEPSDSQLLFFSRKEGFNYVYPIPINKNGDLSSNQPDEYRGFFIKEQMKLLGL